MESDSDNKEYHTNSHHKYYMLPTKMKQLGDADEKLRDDTRILSLHKWLL